MPRQKTTLLYNKELRQLSLGQSFQFYAGERQTVLHSCISRELISLAKLSSTVSVVPVARKLSYSKPDSNS